MTKYISTYAHRAAEYRQDDRLDSWVIKRKRLRLQAFFLCFICSKNVQKYQKMQKNVKKM